MPSLIQELLSPQLMMAIYCFIGFIVALYVLSVLYVFIDAYRRGSSFFWAWGLLSLIPFLGLIAYLALRPHSYRSDREEQELDMALRERQLAQYGTCPNCGSPIEKDFVVCPVCNTQVRNVCPSCKRPLDAHWKVCPYCRTHIQ
ncbi:MAG TPA: zinc ribbon domain-containing protein [Candidatus Limicola stercorigallinarum]|nr:zinc ribbon domain-containing protein [Candidatus Limicola stercorigallinarum]